MNDDGLRRKVVLVTGSGRGLAAAIARAAGAEKARVVVNARRDLAAAQAVAEQVEKAGGEAMALRADVTDFAAARSLVDETLARWGRIDVLVNSVGSFSWKALVDLDLAEWRRIVASNLDSVFHMCRLVVPHMREQRFGRIINFGAVGAATQCEPQTGAYTAAKAAVIALSRALALEEARAGITVNVVSPGLLRDETGDSSAAVATDAILGERLPVGHPGRAVDVVRAVLFFASPAADFVTGQVIEVAGGART